MKEIREILQAFDKSCQLGKKTVLATVVEVIGSSYRRPGARMLIDEEGRITGAISGGCLEGDAMRKAMLCMHQGANKLVTYDTTLDDDREFGIQLGCNGLVRILFEPLEGAENTTIGLLRQAMQCDAQAVLITFFSAQTPAHQPGTCLLYERRGLTNGALTDQQWLSEIEGQVAQSFQQCHSVFQTYSGLDALTVFTEFLQPAVTLVIAGAGNDAMPLVALSGHLGWRIIVVDGRATHATVKRFPLAGETHVLSAEQCAAALRPGDRTAYMLMTHNYNYDLALLGLALRSRCFYIGLLGPKAKRERMLSELRESGQEITPAQESLLYGPAGLDIGAETADEIALSIATEMMAVLAGREGGALRAKTEFIHARNIA